ncbi:MAG: fasciclin domain-containing protein [Halobacteriota archaeon]|jgi:PGF-CTERM protein
MVNKTFFSAVLATVVVLSIVGGSSVAFAQTQTATATSTATPKATQTIAQIAANNTNLTKLVSLLKLANLTDVLNGPGNFTVFAPTNAAFDKVNASTLAALQNNTTALKTMLLYHVIPKKFLSSDFMGNGTLQTLNGLTLPYSVNGTTVKVDDATVTKADINATNGVIHVVDGVLMPPTTGAATASATASGGFLGLPGFEALYAVAGLLIVAYLAMRRRK